MENGAAEYLPRKAELERFRRALARIGGASRHRIGRGKPVIRSDASHPGSPIGVRHPAPQLEKFGMSRVKERRFDVSPRELEQASDAVARTKTLFADRASRRVFESLMRFRTALAHGIPLGLASCYLPAPTEGLYFPEDLVRARDLRYFVDCGAYRGDTLWSVLHAFPHHRIERYDAFEPDPRQFRFLERNIAAMAPLLGGAEIRAVRKVLCDRAGTIGFDARGDGLSRIDRGRKTRVPSIRLDDFLGSSPVSFLKIEAEGDEIAVLKGAVRSVRRWRPFLAVTVYHEVDDLWEIPSFIHGIAPGYRLVLRHHGWDASRTVCYAISNRAG